MCSNTLPLTSLVQYPSEKWWLKGGGKVLRAVRVFFLFAGPAYHEELGQQGRSHFPGPSLLARISRVQAEISLNQCKTPLHRGTLGLSLSIPMWRRGPRCLRSAFFGGGQWANSSAGATVMPRSMGVSLSGGLGGMHPRSPPKTTDPAMRVGRSTLMEVGWSTFKCYWWWNAALSWGQTAPY